MAVAAEIADAEQARQTADMVSAWTAADVQRMLGGLAEGLSADVQRDDTRAVRAALADLVEYDPESRQAVIRYRLTGFKLASPRRFELRSPP